MRFFFTATLCALLLLSTTLASAQDDTTDTTDDDAPDALILDDDAPSPLIALMQTVPDVAGSVYYIDMQASIALADGVEPTPALPLPLTARWVAMPEAFSGLQLVYETMPDFMGFDYPDILHALAFGDPPDSGVVWRGVFDAEAVITAHSARDHIREDVAGLQAVCHAEGCTSPPPSGERVRGNLFDPALGRQFPFFVVPHADSESVDLVALRNPDLVLTTADAINGDGVTLWDNDAYRTLAAAILQHPDAVGTLVQAHFVPVTDAIRQVYNLRSADGLQLPDNLRDGEGRVPGWAADYRAIPEYDSLLAFADFQHDDEQITVIAVLYDFAGNADFAATALTERIESFSNFGQTRSSDAIAQTLGAAVSHTSYTDESGLAAAVIAVRHPATTQENPFFGAVIRSLNRGMFYPLWEITLP